MMEFLSRRLGVSLIWPSGRWGLPVPHRTPVTIVVGKQLTSPSTAPLPSPTEEQVNSMHEELTREMKRMYHRWQDVAGYSGIELELL